MLIRLGIDRSGGPGRPELFLTIDIEPILMYIEGVPNTVTLNTTWRRQAYCAPMTYCWGVDKPSHDVQEFMGHVSDWMVERVPFRSVPVLCIRTSVFLKQETLECTKCVVAMPKVTDFFQIGSLVAHQALYWLMTCSNLKHDTTSVFLTFETGKTLSCPFDRSGFLSYLS